MNLDEVKKHVVFQCFFIAFVIFCLAFTLFWLLTSDVKASTGGYTYWDMTTRIQNTSRCGSVASGYFCEADINSFGDTWNKIQSNINHEMLYPLSVEFTLHDTGFMANARSTIALYSFNNEFRNINYYCEITYSGGSVPCSAVYSNGSRINLNFEYPSQVTRLTVFVTANGNNWARGDYFGFDNIQMIQSQSSQPTNADIIQNNTDNTQDIINNNNSNTQDVINNQNQNTQNILDKMVDLSYPSCDTGYRNFLIGSDKSYIANNQGRVNKNTSYFITQPIKVQAGSSYTLDIVNATNIQYGYYCFYNKLNQRISCTKYNDNTTTSYTFTAPTDAYYVRFTLYRSNNVFVNASLQGYTCVPDTYESNVSEFRNFLTTSDMADYLKDDSNPTIDDDAISGTLDLVSIDDPLGYLATLPLTLLAKINSNLSSNTCTPFSLGRFGGSSYNFTLPCIQPEQYLGSSIWTFIDLIVSVGLLSISVYKLHHTINNFLGMGSENEVNSYSAYWSPMEFLMIILGGGKGYDAAYKSHFGGDD